MGDLRLTDLSPRHLAELQATRDSDTRPKDGDAPKIAAPLAGSAGLKGIAQNTSIGSPHKPGGH